MKLLTYLLFVLVTLFFSSCHKDLNTRITPQDDFSLFFEYLKHDYAYRDNHLFTMDDLHAKYLPAAQLATTNEQLASILVQIEHELKDPHFYFGCDIYALADQRKYIPDTLDLTFPLLNNIKVMKITNFYTYGTVLEEPEVGYLYIKAFNLGIGGTSAFEIEEGVRELDKIIKKLLDKGVTSMIVDMRSDAGGSSYVPRYMAQRFIDKEVPYMVENFPVGESFERKEWILKPDGEGFRTGRIALLSNGRTASGGEMFVLAMLQRDNLIHIGSNTAGAAGNIVEKDLSNGWNFIITNSKTEFPDGTQYFQVGIPPQLFIKNDYGVLGQDLVLEKAIAELAI